MTAAYFHTYHNQAWVLKEIKETGYFTVDELFSAKMRSRYSVDQLWSFLDPRMLANLLFIREERGNSITINHGSAQQRGFRENICPIVKGRTDKNRLYASAHVTGNAVDFHEDGTSAAAIRDWIEDHADELPYPCRLEDNKNGKQISWVHMDCNFYPGHPKVYRFDV